MGRSDCVDVIRLHQLDITDHILFSDSSSFIAGEFMPVDAFEHDPFAVDFHQAVLEFKCTKSDFAADSFQQFIGFILQAKNQCIKIRRFGAPFRWMLDRGGQL
ncbi:hypothetical protein D3C77_473310 [compost metagenome]